MRIYVIRHGETDGNHRGVLQGQMDLPLNEKGRDLAILTGKALADVPFDLVISSPLSRARETAQLILTENHFWTPQEAQSESWTDVSLLTEDDKETSFRPIVANQDPSSGRTGNNPGQSHNQTKDETANPLSLQMLKRSELAESEENVGQKSDSLKWHNRKRGYLDRRIQEISFGEWEGKGIRPNNWELPESFRDFYRKPFSFAGGPGGESIQALCARTGAFYQELIARPEYADKTILISTHGCAMRALLHQVYPDKTNYWHGKVPDNCAVNVIEVNEKQESLLVGDDLIYYDSSLCANPFRDDRIG